VNIIKPKRITNIEIETARLLAAGHPHRTIAELLKCSDARWGEGSPISALRGIPHDVSAEVRFRTDPDQWDNPDNPFLGEDDNDIHPGDHSASWLGLDEIERADWKGLEGSDFVTHTIPMLQRLRDTAGVTSKDVRIVFSFDN
jgi:hypothetical protein